MAASPPTGLLTSDGREITRADVNRVRRQAHAESPLQRPNDAAGHRGTFFSGWRSALRSADADWLYDRDQVVARARDASRNDVVGASAGARKVNRVVGKGWRFSSRATARALGLPAPAVRELRAQINTQFRLYAYGHAFLPDAERKKSFGALLRLGASHLFHDGEALAIVEYASDEPTRFKTRLRMVDPDRLSNPYGKPDSPTLRGGVQKDAYGRVEGYWIREGHPSDVGINPGAMTWTFWPRYATPLGRPQVLHAFEEKRAGQSRGISQFVAVLKSLRGLNRYTDATLEATTLNALFVAFAKSSAGPEAVSEYLTPENLTDFDGDRASFYEKNPITLGGAQIPVLPFGDEIEMQTTSRDTGGFDAFVRAVLRLIAAALGITYEELSMDFSQTNYSSARAALAIAWGEMQVFASILAEQIAQPFFVAWLEEAFDVGAVVPPAAAPDFYDAIEAYSEGRWIGPGPGTIDPTKEVDAAAARIEAQLSTLEDECADLGKDHEEVMEELAAEQAMREELGLGNYGDALHQAGQDARDPLRNKELETAPNASALGRLRTLARSAEHNAQLETRP